MRGYKKVTKTERIPSPGGYVKRSTTKKADIPEIEDEPRRYTLRPLDDYNKVLKGLREEGLRELGFKP